MHLDQDVTLEAPEAGPHECVVGVELELIAEIICNTTGECYFLWAARKPKVDAAGMVTRCRLVLNVQDWVFGHNPNLLHSMSVSYSSGAVTVTVPVPVSQTSFLHSAAWDAPLLRGWLFL